MSFTSAGSSDDCVVIFKNLPLDSHTSDIEAALKSLKVKSTSIDRKVDSTGHFRGTAFVRFATRHAAVECVDKVDASNIIIRGKKLKGELMRQGGRSRAYSAKEVLDSGSHVDAKASRVRDCVTAFVFSNDTDIHLPTDLDADQRKLAHALAEKFGLVHTTQEIQGDMRTVYLSKHRTNGQKPDPSHPRASKSLLRLPSTTHTRDQTARSISTILSHSDHISHMQPEIPVFAAPRDPTPIVEDNSLDRLALMHAAQAQIHAQAARAALEASKHSRDRDAMPPWLEIVEQHSSARSKSGIRQQHSKSARLNANAPAFVPSGSILGPPPGLH
jgi:hypothetical protein